jgi:hypothetical protein
MAELAGGSTINGYPLVGKRANDNYITKMSGNTLVNSNIYDDGTMVRVASFGANSFVVGDPVNLGSNGFAMSIAAPSNDGGLFPFGIIKNGTTNIFKITNVGAVLVYNQIQSSVATGIAPMTIASTTKVVNLNADLLDDMDTSTLAFANTIVARDTNANIVAKQFSSTIGQGGKPFYITSTTMCDNLNADMVDGYHFDQSLLTSTTPTFSGLNTTGNYPITARLAGYKSWTMHHPASNNLIFAASTSNGAVDFSWSNTIQFSDTGNVQATSFTANSTNRGFYHKYSSDTIGLSTYRSTAYDYQIRVNENGSNSHEDTSLASISLAFNVWASSPLTSLSYKPNGGSSWVKSIEVDHLTGKILTKDKFGTSSRVATETSEDLTLYVRTDGNDNNSGRTAGTSGALKTITKALSMIPKQVNHTVTIIVNPGSYSEGISIVGFNGSGTVSINAASYAETPATHTVSGQVVIARNSCRITLTGFKTTYTVNPFYSTNCNEVFFEKCATDTNGEYGFYVENAKIYIYDCLISSKTSAAIYAHSNGEILAQDCKGGSNFVAYQAAYGGRVHVAGNITSSTKKMNTYEGGIVTDRDGIVNPWGSNNATDRSGVGAGASTTQSFPSATWTKIVNAFGSQYYDYQNEYSESIGRFSPNHSGVYNFDLCLCLLGVPAGIDLQIRMYKNGNPDQIVGRIRTGSAGDTNIFVSTATDVVAGHYVEFYLYNGYGSALTSPADGNHCWYRARVV